MKIRWVEATNFRKFVGTVRVDGIGDGLNVLVGPNEMGKSTLMEAINGVVFEKAKAQTNKIESFRHLVNGTVPEVSLGFDLGGKIWTLTKRFAGPAGKALLHSSDGPRYEGEEAEAELQRTAPARFHARWTLRRARYLGHALGPAGSVLRRPGSRRAS